MGAFVDGFGTLFRAVGLFSRSGRLRRLGAIPAVISAVLLAVLLYLSVRYGGVLLARFWPVPAAAGWREGLLVAGHWLAQVLVTLVLILISGVVFFFGSSLIAEPFLDFLCEAAERELGVTLPEEPVSLRRLARDLGLVVVDVGIDLGLFILLQALLLLVNLVPGVGHPVYLAGSWLVNAALASVQMAAISLSRRRVRGWARWRVWRRNQGRMMGLGVAIVLVLLVPLAQLLTLPLAAVAATITVVDLERAGRLKEPDEPTP